jgi:chromosome segregation ATPase
MLDWITKAIGWLLKKEGAAVAIEGYDRLMGRLENRLAIAEKRLDECDDDRTELHKRADDCDEDRHELRREVHDLKDKYEDLEQRTIAQ